MPSACPQRCGSTRRSSRRRSLGFGAALGTDDAAARVEELAALGGFGRLRELGVPAEELEEVAVAIAERPGAKANPRAASADEIAGLLRSLW